MGCDNLFLSQSKLYVDFIKNKEEKYDICLFEKSFDNTIHKKNIIIADIEDYEECEGLLTYATLIYNKMKEMNYNSFETFVKEIQHFLGDKLGEDELTKYLSDFRKIGSTNDIINNFRSLFGFCKKLYEDKKELGNSLNLIINLFNFQLKENKILNDYLRKDFFNLLNKIFERDYLIEINEKIPNSQNNNQCNRENGNSDREGWKKCETESNNINNNKNNQNRRENLDN